MRKQVLDAIQTATAGLDWAAMEPFTANYLCERLNINRNTVSQYLNEYVQQGVLVKVKSRPVYFLHRHTLEEMAGASVERDVYETVDELRRELSAGDETEDFSALLGHDGSLAYCVEQCRSSVAYPPDGLPVLLYGEAGVGKSQMARLMYQYGVNSGCLPPKAPFVTLNCAEYANNPELMATNLFGHVKGAYTGAVSDSAGLLAAADGGLLFLDEVHCLPPACQEKLFLFMDRGVYHRVGDNVHWHSARVRFVFATTEPPEEVLLKTLLRRIPVTAHIPSLAERPERERHNIICHVFRKEMRETGRQFLISRNVMQLLMQHRFQGNIGEMLNTIRAVCANAYLTGGGGSRRIPVRLFNLPDRFLTLAVRSGEGAFAQEALMTLEALEEEFDHRAAEKDFYILLLQAYEAAVGAGRAFQSFWEDGQALLKRYQDQLSYDAPARSSRLELLESLMESLGTMAAQRFSLALHNSDLRFLARHFYRYTGPAGAWPGSARALDSATAAAFPKEYAMAAAMAEFLHGNVRLVRTPLDRVFLTALVTGCTPNTASKTMCFVLCHGHSTASSLAGAANALLGCYMFDAVDMPLGVSLSTVVANLLKRMEKLEGCEQLVFLVDLGSLEEVTAHLEGVTANVGLVNNVSLRLMLSLGQQLRDGAPLQQALESSAAHSTASWRITRNRRRGQAILSVCATGMETSQKIAELLRRCLPRDTGLEVVPCEFGRLAQLKQDAPVFRDHQVPFIIGTLDPKIDGVPFVSLDQLLLDREANPLHRLLTPIYSQNEILELEANLVREFTMQNVMGHLTILNGEKLMEVVTPAVQALMERMGRVFSRRVVTGLYLHLCCMVEKLVMHRAVSDGRNPRQFAADHADFIRQVRESFCGVEKEYSVEIPLSEMEYLYEYVREDEETGG